MRLQNKTAIITGGAQGIGREYALRFAREGTAVAIADLREAQAREVEAEIANSGGRALAVRTDVTDQAQMTEMARQVADRFGTIDVLVNNAAI
jgi:3-oxoacyl-[acyl-carrier protein] reductase